MSASDDNRPASRWPLVVAVIAVASLPYVTLFAANVGEELAEGHLLLWWAVTVVASMIVLAALLPLPTLAARWWGSVFVVVLYLLFNLPGALALRDALGWEVGPLAWWFGVAGAAMLLTIPLARLRHVQSFVLLVAPLLLVAPTFEWVTGAFDAAAATPPGQRESPAADDWATTPNVWYFVLDGLASTDFVRERTGHDGTGFVGDLADRGFVISPRAESNYPLTTLSVSAALERGYVYFEVDEPRGSPFFARLQGHNRTVDELLAHGYSYAHTFPGFWRGSRCSGREDFCFGANGPLNDTEVALADLTPLGFMLDTRSSPSVARANDPSFVVDQVLAADLPEPAYHFVHLLNPHPPYVRAADCSIRDVEMRLAAWGDGDEYGDAVACLNQQLTEAVDKILAVDEDPVIVIQGDHGPRFGVDRSVEGGVLYATDMFFSIFSAVRLPSACADIDIPPDLTPVNTFRIVFACLEGEQPELLPNRRYPIRRP